MSWKPAFVYYHVDFGSHCKRHHMSHMASPLDVEIPEARGWPMLCATVVAAVVAPAVTTALLSMVSAAENLL
jgi:hypothetical protein